MEKDIIKEKIIEIKNVINLNYNSTESIGLFTHNGGIALFNLVYADLFKDENTYNKVSEIVDSSIEIINKEYFVSSICGGLSGFLWLLEYFNKKEFIDEEIIDSFSLFDEYFEKQIELFIQNKNFDFLHGALGVGFYLLKKSKKDNKYIFQLEKLVKALIDNAEINNNTAKWLTYSQLQKHYEYNLSLSHGMASILIFLSKYYEHTKDKEVKKLIQQVVNYYKSVQNKNIGETGSYYPSSVYENQTDFKGRFSWCYGDLGIGFAFLRASEVIEDLSLKDLAYNIFDFNTNKRDLKVEGIFDAGLCHGATSFASIYHRLYIDTKKELYKETRDFWVGKIFEYSNYKDGLAGFKFFDFKMGMVNDYSMLTGITGIGLTLLSIYSETDPDWDECLLLS